MKKEIFIATIVYTVLTVLQPLSNFILLPIYTKHFSEAEYGIFSILNNINTLFAIISGLGIVHAIIAFYTQFSDQLSLKKYVGDVLTFTLYFNLILLLVFSVAGNLFFRLIFKENISFYPNGVLTISYGLLSNLITGYLFFLKYDKKILRFAKLSITLFVLNTAVQYYFIVYLKQNITGALSARVISTLICFLIIVLYHNKYLFRALNFKLHIVPSLKYSINTIPSSVIIWITTYGDRFFIDQYLNLRSLGIYSFLATICSIIEMIFLAVGAAIQPFIFDYYKSKEIKKIKDLYGVFIASTLIACSLIVLIGSNLDKLIVNKGYLEIVQYLPIMASGFVFSGLSYLFNLQIIYSQKSKFFLHIGFFTLVANVSLNALLVPTIGIWGAVISNVATKFITACTVFYLANKSMKISFDRNKLAITFFLISVIYTSWFIAYLNLVTFKSSSILQFVICLITLFFLYRRIAFRTLKELRFSSPYKS